MKKPDWATILRIAELIEKERRAQLAEILESNRVKLAQLEQNALLREKEKAA